MSDLKVAEKYKHKPRVIEPAQMGDDDLGPLQLLPGHWQSKGRGWNMIALPFAPAPTNFRLLMNQYDEDLKFTLVDKGVPNRGIKESDDSEADQIVVTLDYEQQIKQIIAEDTPTSPHAGAPDLAIHHEPGLWLHMTNENTNELDIARLATIPHGNSALGLGKAEVINGPPTIPVLDGLPIGAGSNVDGFYMGPYKHYIDQPFFGTVPTDLPGFPGFHPEDMNAILRFALDTDPRNVVRTTVLDVDTSLEKAGIANIPFVEREADASVMKSTFWIHELDEKDDDGKPVLRMQYSQLVMLDFFERRDGEEGLIQWPHISINTLDKISEPPTV